MEFQFFRNFSRKFVRKKVEILNFEFTQNLQEGVFFDADSEYLFRKIVKCVSRELWPFFFIFRVVTLFEPTRTPLEVDLLQNLKGP